MWFFLKQIKYKNIAAFLSVAIFFCLTSCEEDLTNAVGKKKLNFPSQVINGAQIIQRDSGFVKIRATAVLIEKYELIDSPYIEARKGIYIQFFDKKKPEKPGTIKAKYAKIIESKQFYEAKGNVRIVTNEGQIFATQSIYWDKKNKKMYTSDTVFVTDKDGSTLIGANGMTAKDDFSAYTFYNNSGDINAKKIPEGQR
ncbi:LPS export ABC transporter periplasmic protein LptC [Halpernia frigidisoli]|uniref:LPS export ABC transporter protein LptC n=1 Tax=Halpernia frigidisoli TaxID=1125876 RepID=A0A1I3CSL0_9FLAO|nr:LPS export ABC transporter periplasmic protein LptC [Halpernia frigidisoli]SFH77316.1 LPS export ABC transporter protein LptC [Halpernia frigidisoli]